MTSYCKIHSMKPGRRPPWGRLKKLIDSEAALKESLVCLNIVLTSGQQNKVEAKGSFFFIFFYEPF